MDTFWRLMEKSTLTSGVIAVALVATTCYCVVTETPLPDYLIGTLGTVVGFFFGSKTANVAHARRV